MRPAHGEWGLPETRRDGIGQCLGAVSGTPVDRDDRHAIQQTGQPFRIDATAIAKRQIVHGKRDDGRQSELHHHRQQVERTGQRRGVQHHDGEIGSGHARRARQRIDGDLFIGAHRQ